jgi:hypothetical protein
MPAQHAFARQHEPVTEDACRAEYIPDPGDVSRSAKPYGTRSPQEEHVSNLTQTVA